MGKMLEQLFTPDTLSVHVKPNMFVQAKRGKPGDWRLVELPISLSAVEIDSMIKQIQSTPNAVTEISYQYTTVIQKDLLRIIITRPPLSNTIEITVIRATAKKELSYYKLSDAIVQDIASSRRGVLVAGAPGNGKSTFAAALADYLVHTARIVKTIESPRDLVVHQSITQFAKNFASADELKDIFLLSRPDYIIFDEIRNSADYHTFSDLRLCGTGMIGVIHATKPIDAIQRFIQKMDLGLIPQIIDTVIFIANGQIQTMFDIKITVKVPTGMSERDLARPVLQISQQGLPEYEIYSYGDQTIVIPLKQNQPINTSTVLENIIKKHTTVYSINRNKENECEYMLKIPHSVMNLLDNDAEFRKIVDEKKLVIRLIPLAEKIEEAVQPIQFQAKLTPNALLLEVDQAFAEKAVQLLIDTKPLVAFKLSKKAQVKIRLDSQTGEQLQKAIRFGLPITLVPDKISQQSQQH